MERTSKEEVNIPSIKEIRFERRRLARQNRKRRIFFNTIYTLIIVAAVAVLLATLFFPVLQVSGASMEPTLEDRQIILLIKTNHLKTGDLCSFNWQNKLLIKRIIGGPGDIINIDEKGVVTVNGKVLDEPYVDDLALGECDISFPYQVPDNRYFVLGDHTLTNDQNKSETENWTSIKVTGNEALKAGINISFKYQTTAAKPETNTTFNNSG